MRLWLGACLMAVIVMQPVIEAQRRPMPAPRPLPPVRSGGIGGGGGAPRAGVPSRPRPSRPRTATPRTTTPTPRPRVTTPADATGAARRAESAAALRKALLPPAGSPKAVAAQKLAKSKADRLRAQRQALLRSTAASSTLRVPGAIQGRAVRSRTLMNSGVGSRLAKKHAETFASGSYTEYALEEDLIVYRVWHPRGAAGSPGAREFGTFWTTQKPDGSLKARIDAAIQPGWGNPATKYTALRVPRGTRVYSGQAGSQTGPWVGGGNQVIIKNGPRPAWKIEEGELK